MGLGLTVAVNGIADAELATATMVEVQERMGQPTTYILHYAVDISEGDLPLLTDARLDAGSEITLSVPTSADTVCLVKGPVSGQQIHFQHGGEGSTLAVQGGDTAITMDREARSQVWAGLTDSDAVSAILANYGFIPDVASTSAGHFEDKHTLIQRQSDFQFIQQLARRNGYLFWISSDAMGIETAHFKRPPLGGSSVAELIINLDSPNIQQLELAWDVERTTSVEAAQLDLNQLSDIDGGVAQTPLELLGGSGLVDIAGDTRSQYLTAPSDDGGDLQARGEGSLIDSGWFIRASCQTTYEQLGSVIRAHSVVDLRGAGQRHSGQYFVSAVRHVIDAVSHCMEIELIRNAWE
jgi:hypothetical protein